MAEADIKYNVNRQYVYRWRIRHDRTMESQADRSHRPKSHPNQLTETEIKLTEDTRRRNTDAGSVAFRVKLIERGYTRKITGLYRVLRRLDQMPVNLPDPQYIAKTYEEMTYPGQRLQAEHGSFIPKSNCPVNKELNQRDDHDRNQLGQERIHTQPASCPQNRAGQQQSEQSGQIEWDKTSPKVVGLFEIVTAVHKKTQEDPAMD